MRKLLEQLVQFYMASFNHPEAALYKEAVKVKSIYKLYK